jgi:hypothetical protein
MMGLEPTTFCMASRRSSQLSYIRERPASIASPFRPATPAALPRTADRAPPDKPYVAVLVSSAYARSAARRKTEETSAFGV